MCGKKFSVKPEFTEVSLAQVLELLRTFEIGVMRLRPGDTILLRSSEKMSEEQMSTMGKCGRMVWPDNQVVVLPKEITVEVVEEGS